MNLYARARNSIIYFLWLVLSPTIFFCYYKQAQCYRNDIFTYLFTQNIIVLILPKVNLTNCWVVIMLGIIKLTPESINLMLRCSPEAERSASEAQIIITEVLICA